MSVSRQQKEYLKEKKGREVSLTTPAHRTRYNLHCVPVIARTARQTRETDPLKERKRSPTPRACLYCDKSPSLSLLDCACRANQPNQSTTEKKRKEKGHRVTPIANS